MEKMTSRNIKNCSEYWNDRGIITNAQTMPTFTKYYIVGLTKNIENMIDYISGLLTDPDFDNIKLKDHYKAVEEELLIKLNNPLFQMDFAFYSSIKDSINDSFGKVLDYESQLKNLKNINMQDIVDYYHKWYTKDNITIIIVSNKSESEVRSYFSRALKNTRPLQTPNTDEVPSRNIDLKFKESKKILRRKDSKKTSYFIGFINNNPTKDDFVYCNLIKDILTGDMYSLMYKKLRNELNLVYGIGLDYDVDKSYIISTFKLSTQFKNTEKLLNSFKDVLKKFISNEFDDNLISRSKERLLIMDMNNSRNNTEFIIGFYANQNMLLNTIDITPDEYTKIINNVSRKKLLKVIERLFNFDNMIVVCETA